MRRLTFFALIVLFASAPATAQSLEASVHFAGAQWSEFDGTDLGIGGRLTWRPMALVGIDADLTWYPSQYPEPRASFSDARLEGLFGLHVGPTFGVIRPFAKASAGFLRVTGTDSGMVCIAIFPPPLACVLAVGETLPAFEVGGGVAVNVGARSFVRADLSDRMLKYPGPTFRSGPREVAPDGFTGHAIRFTVGGGIRF